MVHRSTRSWGRGSYRRCQQLGRRLTPGSSWLQNIASARLGAQTRIELYGDAALPNEAAATRPAADRQVVRRASITKERWTVCFRGDAGIRINSPLTALGTFLRPARGDHILRRGRHSELRSLGGIKHKLAFCCTLEPGSELPARAAHTAQAPMETESHKLLRGERLRSSA